MVLPSAPLNPSTRAFEERWRTGAWPHTHLSPHAYRGFLELALLVLHCDKWYTQLLFSGPAQFSNTNKKGAVSQRKWCVIGINKQWAMNWGHQNQFRSGRERWDFHTRQLSLHHRQRNTFVISRKCQEESCYWSRLLNKWKAVPHWNFIF